jgi:hypothetical protein
MSSIHPSLLSPSFFEKVPMMDSAAGDIGGAKSVVESSYPGARNWDS